MPASDTPLLFLYEKGIDPVSRVPGNRSGSRVCNRQQGKQGKRAELPIHSTRRHTMKNSQDKNNIVRAAMRKKQQEAEGGRARRRPRNETGAMGPPSARRSGGASSPGGGSSTSRSHKPKVSKRVRDLYELMSARDDASSRGADFDDERGGGGGAGGGGGGGGGRAPSSLKDDDVDEALRLAAKVVEPPPRREPTPRKVQRQHLLPSSADPVYVEERRSLPCCAVCCTV